MRKQPQEVFYKECVLKNFAKFTGKHLCYSLFVDEVAGWRLSLNKRLSHRCFPVNFGKFLKAPSLPSFQATASEYMQNKSKYWLIKFLKEQHFICFNKISTCFQCIQNFVSTCGNVKCHVQILSGCFYMLNLSWQRPLSYRNQSIDLHNKSMDWFLYHNGLRHERVKLRIMTNHYLNANHDESWLIII